ncbi:MAG: nickel-type superoxide dismutase maturation protease [bacterium]|nr:nickel-type superoxide dismutase maturation protease [bacterium]
MRTVVARPEQPAELRRFEIVGDSMLPALAPGAHVLAAVGRQPEIGDIVVCRHPFRRSTLVIKRVQSVDARDRLVLAGDNPAASTDSRTLGAFPRDLVIGTVVEN